MRLLHVANGHCTTGLIELSGVPGRTMVWCDPLNEGAGSGNVSDEELLRMRAEFLAGSPEHVTRWPPISRIGAPRLTLRTPTTSWCCGSSTICSISSI